MQRQSPDSPRLGVHNIGVKFALKFETYPSIIVAADAAASTYTRLIPGQSALHENRADAKRRLSVSASGWLRKPTRI